MTKRYFKDAEGLWVAEDAKRIDLAELRARRDKIAIILQGLPPKKGAPDPETLDFYLKHHPAERRRQDLEAHWARLDEAIKKLQQLGRGG